MADKYEINMAEKYVILIQLIYKAANHSISSTRRQQGGKSPFNKRNHGIICPERERKEQATETRSKLHTGPLQTPVSKSL